MIELWGYTEEILPMGYKKGDDKIQTQSTRISGLVPQYVLKGHKDSVTSLCIIGVGEIRYLVKQIFHE